MKYKRDLVRLYKKIILVLIVSILLALTGCVKNDATGNNPEVSDIADKNTVVDASENTTGEYSTLDDFTGKKIGIVTGTIDEELCQTYVKDPVIVRFNTYPEEYLGIATGKVDGIFASNYTYEEIKKIYPSIEHIPDIVDECNQYFGLAMTEFGEKLQGEINEYLSKLKADDSLGEITDRWFNQTEEQSDVSFDDLIPEKGTIRYVETVNSEPFFCQGENGYRGVEAEILKGFAEEYGYSIDVSLTEFTSLLAGMMTGKYDLTSGFIYTEERAEKILYSDWYLFSCHYMVYNGSGSGSIEKVKRGFWEGLAESFDKTFIKENRWKLMADGLLVTLEISICSAIFGTLLGVLLCFVRRNKFKVIRKGTAGVIRFLQGIPIVVMLLVLYYVVFANSKISGIIVGIIGFSIDFGVYVSEILRSGIEAIDRGQWEAAEALGFDKFHTYTKVIIPQALKVSLPVYKGQFISMIKMTSVVGYLTVQDLTKASDIIRSRSFEAFFPLLVTSIIYFLIAWGMTSLLGQIELCTDPTRRKDILKGIDTNVQIASNIIYKSSSKEDENVIEIEHLRKEYELVTPLEDVNTIIRSGDVISVIGPSGTGKSTLLRCINHLELPTSGNIRIFGEEFEKNNLCRLRAETGMVFQSFNLFDHLTIIENVMLAPVVIRKIPRQEAYEKAMALLHKVGLAEKALVYPAELSGGQKQRIAIVRAVAMEPKVMLFDEPTSALDPTMINEVLRVIRELAQSGMTMLIVTHEMKFARDVSNRVFYMDEGGIYEDGSSEQIFNSPLRERTRAFINKLSLFTYKLNGAGFDYMKLQSDIMSFGNKEMMDRKVLNELVLCTEELTVQGLSKMGNEYFPAELIVEIDQEGGCKLSLTYGGNNVNIMDRLDEISGNMVKNSISSSDYSFEDKNSLTVEIRKK